jgi:hypothetical protein
MGANGSSVRLVVAMTVKGVAVWEMAGGGWIGGLPRRVVADGGGCVVDGVGTGTGGGGSLMVGRVGDGNGGWVVDATDPGSVQNVLAAAGCGGCWRTRCCLMEPWSEIRCRDCKRKAVGEGLGLYIKSLEMTIEPEMGCLVEVLC